MDCAQSDGATLREHLEAVERKTGKRAKELDECEIPEEVAHIWEWFLALCATRTSNGFGLKNPIQYAEMLAWSALKGFDLHQFEIVAIRALDQLYLTMATGDARKEQGITKKRTKGQ